MKKLMIILVLISTSTLGVNKGFSESKLSLKELHFVAESYFWSMDHLKQSHISEIKEDSKGLYIKTADNKLFIFPNIKNKTVLIKLIKLKIAWLKTPIFDSSRNIKYYSYEIHPTYSTYLLSNI